MESKPRQAGAGRLVLLIVGIFGACQKKSEDCTENTRILVTPNPKGRTLCLWFRVTLGLYRGHIRVMEKKMEATI